jgi:regulator of protease activity HflC (stomatin/prohibitin superfamily)
VIQRFGDVRRLISQTLDPILSAYFRDVAQSSSMLDLLSRREEIQGRATEELGRRFHEYDINCVAVLIGRPESKLKGPNQEDQIEKLFDQLRLRAWRRAEADLRKQEQAAPAQGAERRASGSHEADGTGPDTRGHRDLREPR